MNSRGVVLFVIGAGAIGAAGYAWGVRGSRQPADVRKLQERVELLESSARPTVTRVVISPPATDTSSPAPAAQDAGIEAGEVSNEEIAAKYEAEYGKEPVDAPWASQARRTYITDIEAQLPRSSSLESFDCRSASCRLVVVHESVASSNEFLKQVFLMEYGGPLASTTGGFRTTTPAPTPNGHVRSVVFIARPSAEGPVQ